MTSTDLTTVSWQCVHFTSKSGAAAAWTAESSEDCFVGRFSAAKIADKTQLLEQLSRSLHMPNHIGRNWDGIEEALRDLKWIVSKSYIVFIDDANHLWAASPSTAGVLVEVWLSAAEHWSRSGVSFHLIFVNA